MFNNSHFNVSKSTRDKPFPVLSLCSNKSRTPPTSTSPTCQYLWMNKSWRACSSPLARSFPPASCEMPMGPAVGWGLPGESLELWFYALLHSVVAHNDAFAIVDGIHFRMESTEKCEAIIQHFNGKFIKTPPGVPGAWNVCFVLEEPDIVVVGARSLCFCSLLWSLDSLFRVAPSVPTEPLLCKFADGGQKKRQNQGKYLQNGRPWARDGDAVREPFLTANMNFLSRILAGDQIKNTLLKSC